MKRLTAFIAILPLLIAAGPGDRPATRPTTLPAVQKGDRVSITEHQMVLAGRKVRYRATTGYLPTRDETGKDKANFFFIAYERLEAEPASRRPVTFVFNGGPGAASVWLHLGSLGPVRVAMGNDLGEPPAPPYKLVENEGSWLDFTDLVFIDPVGTGYSRPAPGEKGEAFFGVKEDVASVADFIRLYTTRYERWLSPKYLAGESYGTTRAAALSEYLVDRYGIALSGVALISSVLDFQTLSSAPGNDLPYVLYLPTFTATAWHHKRLAAELQQDLGAALKEAEQFAMTEYLPALAKGSALTRDQRKQIVEKLARLTGLRPDLIEKADLRIDSGLFREELLGEKRQIIGRFDARITGYAATPTRGAGYDPSLSAYLAAYAATFNDYARRQLGYESDLPYEILTDRVHPWNWGRNHGTGGYLTVATELRNAMVKLPHLKVLIASGYFDLATPYLGTVYTVDHLSLSPELRANIAQTYYAGGHMMYHNREALVKLREDVRRILYGVKAD